MSSQNDISAIKQLIDQYIEFYNKFEINKMISLFSQNCLFQNISNSQGIAEYHGKEELYKLAKESSKIFKERRQTITNYIISKDKAVIEIDYLAVILIDLPNGLKAGNQLSLKGVSIFEIEDGKIKRLADFS